MVVTSARDLPEGWCEYPYTSAGYRVNYSLRQATRSVFSANHNEFWMIWTDIAPVCLFLALFIVHVTSLQFAMQPPFYQCLVIGVFLGTIVSRICSSVYHVFNCVSLRANQTLIGVDMLGICCMAFGSPWGFANANNISDPRDAAFIAYVVILSFSFASCAVAILTQSRMRQPLLVVLAVIGNVPAQNLTAAMGFAVGYAVFYRGRFPECFLPPGATDGKIYNSHVLWHILASLSQLGYVMKTFETSARQMRDVHQ